MSFRSANQKYYLPFIQALMIFGIVALCQPWSLFLHRFGLTITLVGLVGFLVLSHIGPEPEKSDDDSAAGNKKGGCGSCNSC